MFAWCARCYRKRIVNVNVNIIVAGLLAMAVTVAALTGLVSLDVPARVARLLGMPWKLGPFRWDEKVVIGALSTVIDLVADLAVYYLLHWLANHLPRKVNKLGKLLDELNPAYAHLTFVQDATLVQVERLVLSPIFYILALGGQHALLHAHFAAGPATAISFTSAILFTRCLHTFWMFHQEKRNLKRLRANAAVASASSPGLTPTPDAPTHPNSTIPHPLDSRDSSTATTSPAKPAAHASHS